MLNLKKALDELAKTIYDVIMKRIDMYGYNERAHKNTLKGSELERSISVVSNGVDEIVFSIADYYEYVVYGWRHTGRYAGTKAQFIENLHTWVRKKGIKWGNMSENQIVYLVYKKINEEGIKARPFINSGAVNGEDLERMMPWLYGYFSTWSDRVFNEIMKEVDKYFK